MTTMTDTEKWEHLYRMERGEVSALDSEHGYNGWSNRETWALNLWLGNEQGTDSAARETATSLYNAHVLDLQFSGDWTDEEVERIAVSKAADDFKSWIEDDLFYSPADGGGLLTADDTVTWLSDIGSLWRVNWLEVTKAFLEE